MTEYIPRAPDERVLMTPDATRAAMTRLIIGETLVDSPSLTEFAKELAVPEPLDPWQTTQQFVACFPENEQLFTADLGLLRPCLGTEHVSAVLGLFEENYLQLVGHDTKALIVFRLGLPFQDSGKVLCKAVTGNNFGQAGYNQQVTKNGLKNLEIDASIKKAIDLLNSQDLIGKLAQVPEDKLANALQQTKEGPLAKLREAWPDDFDVPLDDFLLLFYLCDAGAHTRHSTQTNATSGELEWAVLPEDHQLTHLFERKYPGGSLILRQPLRGRVAALLPHTQYTKHLLDPPETSPLDDPAVYMADITKYLFLRSKQHVEESPEHGQYIRLAPYQDAPSDVVQVNVYQGPENQPDKPLRIPHPYVTVISEDNHLRHFTHYYLRGGRVWKLPGYPEAIHPADQHYARMIRSDNEEMGNHVRQTGGVLEYARQAARIKYGTPLTPEAAQTFLDWYANCGPQTADDTPEN